MVDFIEASPLRIVPLFDTMLVQQGEGSGTPTEPHHTPSPEAQPPSHTTQSSSTLPPITTTSIPTVTLSHIIPIRQYTQRARIAQATIAKSEGSMQQTINELMALCTSLQRKYSELAVKFKAQGIEITRLKARLKLLKDRQGVAAEGSGDNAPIKGRNLDEGEAAAKRASDDTEEMETVLTSMDVVTILASGAAEVPTGSGSIPTVGPPAAEVPTSSDVVPTASLVFSTATVIDAQVARELKEQLNREDQRRSAQIAKDAEIEYHQFALELPIERRIELISDLVKFQDNYAKIYKFQSQQRKPLTKKQKRDYYMAVIKNNLGWKVKDFRGMTFEEIEAKFNLVWKQMEDFISMGSKEEAERIKRKGLSLEQESGKKQKTSEEITKEAKSPDEVPKEKVKEMMQLVLIEEVYVEAL
nr:hypothetical protein [Tanacetum cinerariifolium]